MSNPTEELLNLVKAKDIINKSFLKKPPMKPDEIAHCRDFQLMGRLSKLIDEMVTYIEDKVKA